MCRTSYFLLSTSLRLTVSRATEAWPVRQDIVWRRCEKVMIEEIVYQTTLAQDCQPPPSSPAPQQVLVIGIPLLNV